MKQQTGPHAITIGLQGLVGPTPAAPVTLSITGTAFQIDENNTDFGITAGTGFSAMQIGSTQITFTPSSDGAALGGMLKVYAAVGSGPAELSLDGSTGTTTANWTNANGTHGSGTFNNNILPLTGFND
jgi:hypothetical protein